MSSEVMHQILEKLEADVQSRPASFEFEMAYQAHVAIDRIKFAIRHIEKFLRPCDQAREAGLQLLDALDRLQGVERRFQARSRTRSETANGLQNGSLHTNQTGRDASRNGSSLAAERQALK